MLRWLTQLSLAVLSLFRSRRRVEQELEEELQYHLDREIDGGVIDGAAAEEARYAALRKLGPITQNLEECRDIRRVRWTEDVWQDLRYGARVLRNNPAFSVVAILALALGIGANTAMFSVTYGVLMRPLPYPEADRLAVVFLNYAPRDFEFGTMCVRDYLTWRENSRSFENPSLFRTQRMDFRGHEGAPEQLQGAVVSAGFFPALGVRPLLGRSFGAGDDDPAAAPMVVLSESMWRRRFGASQAVLGRSVVVNDVASTVIGVMPFAVRFPRRETEIWTNLLLRPPTRFGPWFYRGFARLKPGVSFATAEAELRDVALRLTQQNSYYQRVTLPILSLRDALVGTTLKPAILVLAGAVGLVLLIAVVNVANLMLARASVRQREMTLRLSLGAGRGRLIRQLLTESVLLAALGGAAGLSFAVISIRTIQVWNPGNLPFPDAVQLDWTALAFLVFVSLLAGMLFGLAPAVGSARADLNSALKEGGRSGRPTQAGGRLRAAFVVAEIAVSLILLVGAGLLLRSFVNLQKVGGGFSGPPRQILTMLISPSGAGYDAAGASQVFYDEVLRRAREVPGVEVAAVADSLPPDRQGDADSFGLEGQLLAPGEMNPVISVATISPGFFEALSIPLIEGRFFTDYDKTNSEQVAIVSEGFARRYFPNRSAIGKRIKQSGPALEGKWMQIVGVAGNVKYLGLTTDTDPAYYMPLAQAFGRRMFLVVRSSGDANRMAAELGRQIQSIDPGVTLAQIGTMEEALDSAVSRPRFHTWLLGLFAGIALLLAALGIYGVMAYSVVQRTQEIGLRMALGAAQGDVVRMVVGQGLLLGAIGIFVGLCGAFALTRLLQTMLFGIGVTDTLTFAAAALGILLVVLAAALVPAHRATRISPVVALRYD